MTGLGGGGGGEVSAGVLCFSHATGGGSFDVGLENEEAGRQAVACTYSGAGEEFGDLEEREEVEEEFVAEVEETDGVYGRHWVEG